MKTVKFEDVAYLEKISIKLEKIQIPKAKRNPIIKDMFWLTEKLREAYKIIEAEGGD